MTPVRHIVYRVVMAVRKQSGGRTCRGTAAGAGGAGAAAPRTRAMGYMYAIRSHV